MGNAVSLAFDRLSGVANRLLDRVDTQIDRGQLVRQLAGDRRLTGPGKATQNDEHRRSLRRHRLAIRAEAAPRSPRFERCVERRGRTLMISATTASGACRVVTLGAGSAM